MAVTRSIPPPTHAPWIADITGILAFSRQLIVCCKSKVTRNTETGYREFFIKSNLVNSDFLVIQTNDFLNKIRLTLDYSDDLKLAKKIFGKLNHNFTKDDLVNLFQNNPELISITANITKEWELNYEKNKSDFKMN